MLSFEARIFSFEDQTCKVGTWFLYGLRMILKSVQIRSHHLIGIALFSRLFSFLPPSFRCREASFKGNLEIFDFPQ